MPGPRNTQNNAQAPAEDKTNIEQVPITDNPNTAVNFTPQPEPTQAVQEEKYNEPEVVVNESDVVFDPQEVIFEEPKLVPALALLSDTHNIGGQIISTEKGKVVNLTEEQYRILKDAKVIG